jgi:hypothetical protein
MLRWALPVAAVPLSRRASKSAKVLADFACRPRIRRIRLKRVLLSRTARTDLYYSTWATSCPVPVPTLLTLAVAVWSKLNTQIAHLIVEYAFGLFGHFAPAACQVFKLLFNIAVRSRGGAVVTFGSLRAVFVCSRNHNPTRNCRSINRWADD